jgi:hypothetical protein
MAAVEGTSPPPLRSIQGERSVYMTLTSICLYLHQKGTSAIDVRKDIEASLGPQAIGCSTVPKYLREAHITPDREPSPTAIEDEC